MDFSVEQFSLGYFSSGLASLEFLSGLGTISRNLFLPDREEDIESLIFNRTFDFHS